MLDKAWIASHIPHQGAMCLLDTVTSWDAEQITCTATSHLLTDNPLRHANRLGAATGVEYAAQAMAVHGALLAQDDTTPPKSGYLTSIRNVQLHVSDLDKIQAPLVICAQRLMGDENNIMYAFQLSAGEVALLEGRASVMLNAASPLL